MFQLSDYLTPLVRNVLLFLAFSLMVQWGAGAPFVQALGWNSFGTGFMPWQVLTCNLIASQQLQGVVVDWLLIFFTLSTVDRLMGRRTMLMALGFCWGLAVLVGLGADALGLLAPTLYSGQHALGTALITLFCFLLPDANVRLFFVLPLKAAWVGWLSGLIAVYYLAAYRDLGSCLALASWLGAVLWTQGFGDIGRRLKLKFQRRRIEKRLGKFSVIEGGKGKSDPWIH